MKASAERSTIRRARSIGSDPPPSARSSSTSHAGDQQLLPTADEVVDGGRRHLGSGGDPFDRDLVERVPTQQRQRAVDDRGAALGLVALAQTGWRPFVDGGNRFRLTCHRRQSNTRTSRDIYFSMTAENPKE
jgi:hypothetical protein